MTLDGPFMLFGMSPIAPVSKFYVALALASMRQLHPMQAIEPAEERCGYSTWHARKPA